MWLRRRPVTTRPAVRTATIGVAIWDEQPDRREFLKRVGLLPLLGSAGLAVDGAESKLIPDAARDLQSSAADLGTDFAAVEQIAATGQPSVFPIGKQIEFNETGSNSESSMSALF